MKLLDMNATSNLSSSAGGGNSTVSDLHKFSLALKENKLISENSLKQMKTDDFNNEYGLGLSLRDIKETKIYGHGGSTPDNSGELEIVENSPLIIIALSNRSPAEGLVQVNMFIRNEFFGKSPEIERFLNTEEVIELLDKNGFESAQNKLNELNNNISQRLAFYYAYQYLGEEKFEKAINIIRLIVLAFPNDWNAYGSLADSYLKNGNNEQAIINYRKSLEINPENENAIGKLNSLKKN
ncbi:serine hydrolase [Zobellia nedashkovskayae]